MTIDKILNLSRTANVKITVTYTPRGAQPYTAFLTWNTLAGHESVWEENATGRGTTLSGAMRNLVKSYKWSLNQKISGLSDQSNLATKILKDLA